MLDLLHKKYCALILVCMFFSGTSPNSIGSSIMPGLSSPPVTSASHGIGPGIPPPPPPSSAPFSPQHIAGFSPPSLFSRYVASNILNDYL